MDSPTPELRRLSRAECLRLMGTVSIGRIVYTRQAMPAVELVRFALVDGDIVIRMHAEGALAAAVRGAVVAFQADRTDGSVRAGWSVTAVGQARAAAGEQATRLDRVALTPPVPAGGGTHFLCISPTIVTGRRFGT